MLFTVVPMKTVDLATPVCVDFLPPWYPTVARLMGVCVVALGICMVVAAVWPPSAIPLAGRVAFGIVGPTLCVGTVWHLRTQLVRIRRTAEGLLLQSHLRLVCVLQDQIKTIELRNVSEVVRLFRVELVDGSDIRIFLRPATKRGVAALMRLLDVGDQPPP